MVFVRFLYNNRISYGVVEKDKVYELEGNFLENLNKTDTVYDFFDIKILTPVIPSKIICVGLNYINHGKELKMPIPKEPIIFLKPPSSILNPEEDIVCPSYVKRLDYEAELAVIIKKKGKNIPQKDIHKYLFGYTCFNDVTARDIQEKDGQWTRAKSFDTFAPLGPVVVTDINIDNLKIELYLNDVKKQSSKTDNLIFSIEEIVSFVSKVMTLYPGDVIATGTPSGVGPMKPGDIVEVKIDKIGSLRNYVRLEQ